MIAKRASGGFTLIEILVVISIIAVLAGLVTIVITSGRAKAVRAETELLVKNDLATAIDRFKSEFHRYPPMTVQGLARFGARYKPLELTNDTNTSSEVLLVALRHPDISTPLNPDELPFKICNTDEDTWNKTPPNCSDLAALEPADGWGNPVVYIDKDHYKMSVTIELHDKTTVEVHAVKKPDGTYYNPTSYQLISLGKDGVQDEEGGDVTDDIENFTRTQGQ